MLVLVLLLPVISSILLDVAGAERRDFLREGTLRALDPLAASAATSVPFGPVENERVRPLLSAPARVLMPTSRVLSGTGVKLQGEMGRSVSLQPSWWDYQLSTNVGT